MKRGDYNVPMQRYVDMGVLDVTEKPFMNLNSGKIECSYKTTVTPKRQEYFYNKLILNR